MWNHVSSGCARWKNQTGWLYDMPESRSLSS